LDSGWRYHKLLAEYYIRHGEYEKALPVAGSFYLAHPGKYIMGMLYAKVLLLNRQYAAADAALARLNIIPFEGATEGRELYREAKLMQAMQQMKKENYRKALSFIAQSRQWPENLGVGRPYEEDIDARLEDWMSYLCLLRINGPGNAGRVNKTGNTGKAREAKALLLKITAFHAQVENTVRNFFPANALVTAWAFDRLGRHDEAVQWLNGQIQAHPGDPILLWCQSVFEGRNTAGLPVGGKDANMRILQQWMR
jgi:tetratricopeptide (TPR) repeat protein